MGPFDDSAAEDRFHALWQSVGIERTVHYSLFTFGESDLPYYLVLNSKTPGQPVSIVQGNVKITRPLIITPENAEPELRDFFEDLEDEQLARFLLSRTAKFSHLRFQNQSQPKRIVSDSVEEAVAKLNRQLDAEEEDRVAILTAPEPLAGMAVLRYATERVMQSAPDNINELRERGFLP